MSDALQDEVDRLRAEVESHRQRELTELRSALAVAGADIAALRAELARLQGAALELNAHKDEIITKLRADLETIRGQLAAHKSIRR